MNTIKLKYIGSQERLKLKTYVRLYNVVETNSKDHIIGTTVTFRSLRSMPVKIEAADRLSEVELQKDALEFGFGVVIPS